MGEAEEETIGTRARGERGRSARGSVAPVEHSTDVTVEVLEQHVEARATQLDVDAVEGRRKLAGGCGQRGGRMSLGAAPYRRSSREGLVPAAGRPTRVLLGTSRSRLRNCVSWPWAS